MDCSAACISCPGSCWISYIFRCIFCIFRDFELGHKLQRRAAGSGLSALWNRRAAASRPPLCPCSAPQQVPGNVRLTMDRPREHTKWRRVQRLQGNTTAFRHPKGSACSTSQRPSALNSAAGCHQPSAGICLESKAARRSCKSHSACDTAPCHTRGKREMFISI